MSFQVPAVPPGALKYARPSDLVTALAVITCSEPVSSDASYGLPSLYDGIPARPCKILSVGPARIVLDFGAARRVDAVAIPNHNLAPGSVITIAGNATNAWGAPTMSIAVVTGPDSLDGHVASPWADLTQASGYSPTGFRYLSILLPVQAVQIKVGELLVMSELRQFSQWTQFGTRGTQIPYLESLTTEYGVQRVYRRRVSQRSLDYRIVGNDADFEALRALALDAGGLALPWFVVNNSDDMSDGGLMVRFTPDTAAKILATEQWYDVNEIRFSVLELSRSVPL